jgi:hypothetical protein
MKNLFLTAGEASALVQSGAVVVIAGAEELLSALPRGNWIGGTTAYFMTERGGTVTADHLFCSVIERATKSHIATLEPRALPQVTTARYGNGFTYLLLPAFSEAHQRYAIEGPGFPRLFDQPVMGWITGVHLSDLGKRTPKVFDGQTGLSYENAGVALYVELPPTMVPDLDIINRFTPGDGPAIVFPETGFTAGSCAIDNRFANLARHLVENSTDTRLPLVANYAGAMINVSVQAIDAARGEVRFYAPVVAGEAYRLARPVTDYAGSFDAQSDAPDQDRQVLACNCILNFLHAELEGKVTGGFVGPVTFGEIAYILLNQTLVVLRCQQAT